MNRILFFLSLLLISGISIVSTQNNNDDDKWFDAFGRAGELFDQKKHSEAIAIYMSVTNYWKECRSATESDEKLWKGNIALAYIINAGVCYRNLKQYEQTLDFFETVNKSSIRIILESI